MYNPVPDADFNPSGTISSYSTATSCLSSIQFYAARKVHGRDSVRKAAKVEGLAFDDGLKGPESEDDSEHCVSPQS